MNWNSISEAVDNYPSTMDIYTPVGSKIIFTGRNGYNSQLELAKSLLPIGEELTVKHIDVFSFNSYVELEEYPDRIFNTVMFENVK